MVKSDLQFLLMHIHATFHHISDEITVNFLNDRSKMLLFHCLLSLSATLPGVLPIFGFHYENTPMQYIENFSDVKI